MKKSMLLKAVAEKVCVLYDSTGKVVHTHRVVTMSGGQILTNEELETRTRERAGQRGIDHAGLIALEVAAEDHNMLAVYRVEVVTKKLIELPRPAFKGRTIHKGNETL